MRWVSLLPFYSSGNIFRQCVAQSHTAPTCLRVREDQCCSPKLWGSGEMARGQTGTARREGHCPLGDGSPGPFPLQYFVFDFHVSPDVMFDKIIKISVSGEQPWGAGPLAQTAPLCEL